jgi:hypothetical protein
MTKLLYLIFISSSLLGIVQNLWITGPTEVCPGQTYTFTATTTYQGTFIFFVFEDGQWNNPGWFWDCSGDAKSRTFEYIFNTAEEEAILQSPFTGWYFCVERSSDLVVTKRLVDPEKPRLTDGSLSFCGNDTRMISIPTSFDSVPFLNPLQMLKNYLKIGLRSLWKYRYYTGINIFGLAFGLAC